MIRGFILVPRLRLGTHCVGGSASLKCKEGKPFLAARSPTPPRTNSAMKYKAYFIFILLGFTTPAQENSSVLIPRPDKVILDGEEPTHSIFD
jgi:hypothetical protein